MKKRNYTKVLCIILAIIFAAIILCEVGHSFYSAHLVGYTTKTTNEDDTVQYLVAVGATSKLYEAWDSDSSSQEFLDIFNDVAGDSEDLGTLIDEKGFPYKVPYMAKTMQEPLRYLIETNSGSTYWIEP